MAFVDRNSFDALLGIETPITDEEIEVDGSHRNSFDALLGIETPWCVYDRKLS